MKQYNHLTDFDGEVRELQADDLHQFKPIKDVLPLDFVNLVTTHQNEMERQGKIKTGRRKQKKPTKQAITLRLSPEVIEAFKSTGQGWQTRINEVLLKHIQTV
ncbi:BrnA antitoxin family protein [Glaesserella parasuis]|uniref:BrnA antitoxin family protein n=1 Tax=Glaesserella parasuis TaxID=738 RepID=UPI0024370C57|nr:BrnA antitoxin family protein [Glaesserella parasuis]MDG6312996.1 BrnA antitoxin family protein [Glaesserella parasuis]